jgi:hypothetical protein
MRHDLEYAREFEFWETAGAKLADERKLADTTPKRKKPVYIYMFRYVVLTFKNQEGMYYKRRSSCHTGIPDRKVPAQGFKNIAI